MRLTFVPMLLIVSAIGCFAQDWEIGGGAGYGWPLNASVTGGANPVQAGYAPRAAFSVVLAENTYNYLGGEFQYLFRTGGTQLESNGIREASPGYSNILVYNLMIHMRRREAKFRPFIGAGSGIRIYTNSAPLFSQPLASTALLRRGTQVEPAISLDGGAKFMFPHHVQLRLDLRVFTTPAPNDLIRAVGTSRVKGWIYELMPMAGVAYIF